MQVNVTILEQTLVSCLVTSLRKCDYSRQWSVFIYHFSRLDDHSGFLPFTHTFIQCIHHPVFFYKGQFGVQYLSPVLLRHVSVSMFSRGVGITVGLLYLIEARWRMATSRAWNWVEGDLQAATDQSLLQQAPWNLGQPTDGHLEDSVLTLAWDGHLKIHLERQREVMKNKNFRRRTGTSVK